MRDCLAEEITTIIQQMWLSIELGEKKVITGMLFCSVGYLILSRRDLVESGKSNANERQWIDPLCCRDAMCRWVVQNLTTKGLVISRQRFTFTANIRSLDIAAF